MHYIVRLVAALVSGAAVLFAASAMTAPSPTPTPSPTRPADACPRFCTMVYQPVRCEFSNGVSVDFGNTCQAQSYACDHRLRVVGCTPRDTAAVGPAI